MSRTVNSARDRRATRAGTSGETVEIAGWLYNLRRSGKICFPQLRDGTGIMQCVAVKSALPEELFETLKDLTQESSLIIRGKIRAEQRAPGGYELDVESAEIVQRVPESDPYPITPKDHGIDFLMDHRHLWLRSRRQHAALGVRHEVIKGIRDYFDSNGFVLVDTPIFTPAACEGTSTLFEVDYFEDEKVYLTQSGQLYNEATCAAFGKTYCFGPTFRAEKSKTRRHLTEFWMVEPEMAYATLEDVKRVGEELVVFVVGRVLENRREELKVLERDVTKLEAIQAPFHRMSYDDAVKKLQVEGQRNPMGRRFRQHRRNPAHRRSGSSGDGGPLSHRGEGVLFPARRGSSGSRAGRRFHRARRLRRNHRRRPAHPRSGFAAEAAGRAQAAARGVQLVHRSAQIRQRSRTPASAWEWSASSRGCAAWSIFGKPSHSRGCCIARGRKNIGATNIHECTQISYSCAFVAYFPVTRILD